MTENDSAPERPPGHGHVQPTAITVARGGASLADALPLLEHRLAQNPEDVNLLITMARACQEAGRWEEALGYARRATAIAPAADHTNIALDALYRLGDQDAVEQLVPAVLASGSVQDRGVVSLHMVKDRQFARAFNLRHALRHTHKSAGHPVGRDERIPWWDGARFDGTVLVIAEQALGEELLNAGGVSRIAAMGQAAVIESDPRLIPLFRRSFPQLQFVPRFTTDLANAATAGCRKTSASELGYLLCCSDTFENPPGWLKADPVRVAAMRAAYRRQQPGTLLVGISWRSFRPNWGALHKTMQLTDLAPLLALPGITVTSLQYGDIADDLAAVGRANLPVPFRDTQLDPVNDVDGFAAQVAAMDLVITTSNTTAHMAGALGKPTVLMLPTPRGVFPYWCYEGDHTPWYPTIRIVRGNAATPLPAFVEQVVRAVTAVARPLQEEAAGHD